MKYFINFLEEVRVSYKKYIGEKSLYLLKCYLNGFSHDIDCNGFILCSEDSKPEIKKV